MMMGGTCMRKTFVYEYLNYVDIKILMSIILLVEDLVVRSLLRLWGYSCRKSKNFDWVWWSFRCHEVSSREVPRSFLSVVRCVKCLVLFSS